LLATNLLLQQASPSRPQSPVADLWKVFAELSHDAAAHEREARALRSDADILRAEIRRREDADINSGRAPEWNA
jgi:hypothetical protein